MYTYMYINMYVYYIVHMCVYMYVHVYMYMCGVLSVWNAFLGGCGCVLLCQDPHGEREPRPGSGADSTEGIRKQDHSSGEHQVREEHWMIPPS